jgi:hypothetical protein
MATSNYQYINETGLIVADTADLRTQVENEYKAALGEDLDVSPETPEGVLITAETIARANVVQNNAILANQINPNFAGGIFLVATGLLTGSKKGVASNSIVLVTLAGVAGTVIPAGALIQDPVLKNQFQSLSTVTLNGSGIANVNFAAIDPGPIVALAGTLTQILTRVIGWETATNPSNAVVGSTSQSDEAFRLLRRVTLATQGVSLPEAITSALNNIPNFISNTFRENFTSATIVKDGVTLVPHSIYVCADGGSDLEVGTVLVETKSPGANYNNGPGINVNIDITDPVSGQVYPVKFDRPNLIPIQVRVTVSINTLVSSLTELVKQAILDYANGLIDGEEGFVIGAPVSCFELSGAVNKGVPQVFVHNVEIKKTSGGVFSNAEIPIAIFEKATITESSIVVVFI